MSQRVLATDRARVAAQKYGAILDGDVVNALRELRAAGQRLSNPAVWDGPNAREFRGSYWPRMQASIDQALSQLKQLGSMSNHVIADIMKAGSDGSLPRTAHQALSSLWAISAGWKAFRTINKARFYTQWVKNTLGAVREIPGIFKGDPFDPASFARFVLRNQAAEDAMAKFRFASSDLSLLSKIGVPENVLSKLGAIKGVAGKAFLPLTMVSGAIDMITGGGYSGWRGITDRVMGGAGFAGAGALLFAGALGLGPIGIGVAGAAVLAYGAWQVGNLVWDHREAIAHAATAAWNWTSHTVSSAASGVWHTITSPLKLVPHFGLW